MLNKDTSLTPELAEVRDQLWEAAKSQGLDCFETIFELVDYQQLNEVAAYGGFPTRYPHWRWGMEYERLSKSYTYGLSIIYEMVINNDPCYAYLLRANSMVYQKTVIAHVYGHCDFFKNNYWFSKTNRKMLDQMANHATIIQKLINEVSQNEVEDFIDVCLSLENLIDIHSPFQEKVKELTQEEKENLAKQPVSKLSSKKYMDSYVNPAEVLAAQKEQQDKMAQEAMKKFPLHPQRDVLKFLLDHAPMTTWQRKILSVIRDESYYFAPQGQTKILNEGWATYWHSKMMTQIAPLHESEIVDYCDHYAGVVASHGSLNPYKLGVELLRHVEKRWDKGRFGLDYVNADFKKQQAWDTQAGLGKSKLFEIRRIHNDITFLDEFLDEEFCHDSKMFLYDRDPRTGRQVISNRNFKEIKNTLLSQLTNFGQPIIEVVDGNFKNRGELLLMHKHEMTDLKHEFTLETLRNLYKIWNRPVHIETVTEKVKQRVSYNGETHAIEKI